MKKISVIFILILSSALLFGLNFETHIGMLSGFGLNIHTKHGECGVAVESSFPVNAIISGISGGIYNDLNFFDGFILGAKEFIGFDLYYHATIVQTDIINLYAGIDVFTGTQPQIKSIETVAKVTAGTKIRIKNNISFFINAGISILDCVTVPGFEKPLVRVPEINYHSVLTGSKLGLSFKL